MLSLGISAFRTCSLSSAYNLTEPPEDCPPLLRRRLAPPLAIGYKPVVKLEKSCESVQTFLGVVKSTSHHVAIRIYQSKIKRTSPSLPLETSIFPSILPQMFLYTTLVFQVKALTPSAQSQIDPTCPKASCKPRVVSNCTSTLITVNSKLLTSIKQAPRSTFPESSTRTASE